MLNVSWGSNEVEGSNARLNYSGVGYALDLFRPTFAVVDTQAITENVRRICRFLNPQTKLLVAIKANGYGHGAYEVLMAATRGGASLFGLASLEEAIELRNRGVDVPLLMLGAVSPRALQTAADHNVAMTYTDSWGPLEDIPQLSRPLSVHIKVDTGMTRLGLHTNEEILECVEQMKQRKDMTIDGIYTHLACSDSENPAHAQRQMARFLEVVEFLRLKGHNIPLVHASNSGGALYHPDWQLSIVRVGISAYGYLPNPNIAGPIDLLPAMSVYSAITRVSDVGPGETVGYGATFTATERMRVATLPIGYADGYPRLLSNQAHTIIHGKPARILGSVCMDQLMVDVSHIDAAQVGDFATIFGRHAPSSFKQQTIDTFATNEQRVQFILDAYRRDTLPDHVLSLDTLARQAQTISYELMCAVSLRVPRLYTG